MKPWAPAAYMLAAAVAVALDQWVKRLVEAGMDYHEMIEIMPFLALFRTHNTGIAFSFLSGFGDGVLIILTTMVILLVLALAWRSDPRQQFARLGFALIIGGAIGNLIDRVLLGYVIDYVLFHTPVWSFAVFNLADAFITIGAGLIILEEVLAWRKQRRRPAGADLKHGDD
jgi:signal peptidase II